jgi:hypothetical protein
MASTDSAGDSGRVANYIIGFLLIGVAWGFTTPFIRRAARQHRPRTHALLGSDAVVRSPVRRTVLGAWFGVVDLLRDWRYAVPLVVNLTGSVWFFLLIGKAGEFFSFFLWGVGGMAIRRRGRGLMGCRTESDGTDYEFLGVFVHRPGGVVC